jgi:hypothetical protein
MNPNDAAALSMQEKLELYLLTLAFTLAGLSIQTATFNGPAAQRVAELAGWVLFLISGVVGIRRVQWVVVYLRYAGARQRLEDQIFKARQEQADDDAPVTYEDGEVGTLRQYVQDRRGEIDNIEKKESSAGTKQEWMSKFQQWSFIGGLIAIGVSRAYVPVLGLVAGAQLGGFDEFVCSGTVQYGKNPYETFPDRVTLRVSSREVLVGGEAGQTVTFEGMLPYKICSESGNELDFEYTTAPGCGAGSTRAGQLNKALGTLRLSRSDLGEPLVNFVGEYKCEPPQRVLK